MTQRNTEGGVHLCAFSVQSVAEETKKTMRRKFTIPLSYNPINAGALTKKLKEYADRHHNDLVDDFENKIRECTGAKYVVGLNSGTAAIHL